MSQTTITIIVAVLGVIGSISGSILAVSVALKRTPFQNALDDATKRKAQADTVAVYEQTAVKRQQENDELRAKLDAYDAKFEELERKLVGPFRITAEFTVNPLRITSTDLCALDRDGERIP